MVNEERLRYMIKMAEFDTNDGKECKPMIQYARKDYVTLQLLLSFVTGSIAFILIAVMWVLYSMDELMQNINQMDIPAFITSVLIKYVIFILIYLVITYVVYNVKYTTGRKKVKKFYNNVKKVNKIYERDEKLKAPSKKEWE